MSDLPPLSSSPIGDVSTAANFTVYCDGACSGNPGPGGWGAVVISAARPSPAADGDIGGEPPPTPALQEIMGGERATTNNRMEMQAAIEALKFIMTQPQWQKGISQVQVYTDSTYLRNGITSWISSWKRSNWNKGKVKNRELWEELDALNGECLASWHWVKGHSGDRYNDLADRLANRGMKIVTTAQQS